jgi:hypothetical protein
LPHAPQFAVVLERSVSHALSTLPSQSPFRPSHDAIAHLPASHFAVAPMIEHFALHAPQWSTLAVVSTHAPAQHDCPVGHALVSEQPAAQTFPAQR